MLRGDTITSGVDIWKSLNPDGTKDLNIEILNWRPTP